MGVIRWYWLFTDGSSSPLLTRRWPSVNGSSSLLLTRRSHSVRLGWRKKKEEEEAVRKLLETDVKEMKRMNRFFSFFFLPFLVLISKRKEFISSFQMARVSYRRRRRRRSRLSRLPRPPRPPGTASGLPPSWPQDSSEPRAPSGESGDSRPCLALGREKGSLPRFIFWRGGIFVSSLDLFTGKGLRLITTVLPT